MNNTIQIPLTQGLYATVDISDAELVLPFKWQANKTKSSPYATTTIYSGGKAKRILMHRMILGLTNPKIFTDHIDGNGLNNARSNLRICSHSENMKNRKLHKSSSSGVKGVRVVNDRGRQRVRATVTSDGKIIRKWFTSIESADEWATSMRIKLHGKFSADLSRA